MAKAKDLVIVESPATAKTIEKYLGGNYKVTASMGHLRDLPKSKLGVDIKNGFEPEYIPVKDKKDLIAELKKDAKAAETQADRDYVDLRQQLSLLSEDQLRIITAMDAGPVHVDDIMERSQLPVAKVLAQLTMLELNGYVGRLPGRLFERKITKK